jgi:uncharacterized Fe-S cluster-containing radical SAM superfamily protein
MSEEDRTDDYQKEKINKAKESTQQLITRFITIEDRLKNEPAFSAQPTELKSVKHRISGYSGSDPLELAEFLREIVSKDGSRKYYRFRGGRFYGGIAGADCVGCVLDCVYCWSYKPRCNPVTAGKLYAPKHVSEQLLTIAKKKNYNKVRITGNEPTLCKDHLIEVLEYIPEDILFILETNGILLDEEFANALKPFKDHLHVRVSLKGITEEQFTNVTAMAGKYVQYPFRALEHLTAAKLSCNAAIMQELMEKSNVDILVTKLKAIDIQLAQGLEIESLMMYPFIEAELERRQLNKNFKPK